MFPHWAIFCHGLIQAVCNFSIYFSDNCDSFSNTQHKQHGLIFPAHTFRLRYQSFVSVLFLAFMTSCILWCNLFFLVCHLPYTMSKLNVKTDLFSSVMTPFTVFNKWLWSEWMIDQQQRHQKADVVNQVWSNKHFKTHLNMCWNVFKFYYHFTLKAIVSWGLYGSQQNSLSSTRPCYIQTWIISLPT